MKANHRRPISMIPLAAILIAVTHTQAADETATWDGTNGSWSDSSKWDTTLFPNNGVLTYDVIYNAGNLTLDQNIVIEKLTRSGTGTQTGGGFSLTINDLFTWTGGTFAGTGNINADGGIDINFAANTSLSGRTLNNSGAATTAGTGNLSFQNSAVLNNLAGATWTANSTQTIAGSGTFNNAGTYTKASGGTSTIGVTFNNTGTANVDSGILALSGGGTHTGAFNIASGATLNFSGGTHSLGLTSTITDVAGAILQFSGAATTFSGAQNFLGATSISGGTATFNADSNLNTFTLSAGNLAGSGNVSVSGLTTLINGNITGAGQLNANGGLLIDSTVNAVTFSSRTLNNSGDAITSGSFSISLLGTSVINNLAGATWTANSTSNIGGSSGTFNNAGTFTKASAGTSSIVSIFNNTGTVQVNNGNLTFTGSGTHTGGFTIADGATLHFGGVTSKTFSAASTITDVAGSSLLFSTTGSSATFAASQTLLGTTTVSGGTATFNADSTFNILNQTGGTLNGTGDFTVSNLLTWTAGTIGGAADLNANGGISISSDVAKTLNARTLNNAGDVTTSGLGQLSLINATINNLAGSTWTTNGIQSISNTGTFNNAGTYTKNGAGQSNVTPVFNNTGTVNVNAGTLALSGGGTHTGGFTIANGATLDLRVNNHTLGASSVISDVAGATFLIAGGTTMIAASQNLLGTTRVTGGTATFNADSNLTLYNQSGGTLNGAGDITASGLTTWTGGSIAGPGEFNANGGMEINFGTIHTLDTRTLNNAGNAVTLGIGTLSLINGATVNNLAGATWTANSIQSLSGPTGTFNNAGTYIKENVSNSSIAVAFNNSGIVSADAGLVTFSSTYIQTAGETILNGGNITKTGTAMAINGGSVRGSGNINGSINFTTSTIDPGFSAGAIAIAGDLTVTADTTWKFELGGIIQGTEYDFVSEAGTSQFDLSNSFLQLSLINTFTPDAFDSFTIITSNNNVLGTFGNLDGLGRVNFAEGSFFVDVSGNNVILSGFVPIPEPSSFLLFTAALCGALFSRRRR